MLSEPSAESRVRLHFVAGAVAGLAATAASLPLDVVRTRLVAQREPKFYFSMRDAARHMWRQEGLGSFFRGFVPIMLQTAPYTSLQFGAFATFSQLSERLQLLGERPNTRALLCGVLAGLAAKTAVYPLDVTKKRLQVQGSADTRQAFGGVREYRGFLHCLLTSAREEGLRGLYKGLAPSSVKAMATTGLHFTFYELVIRLMRNHQRRAA